MIGERPADGCRTVIASLAALLLLSLGRLCPCPCPCFEEAKIAVVLGLTNNGVSVCKQLLQPRRFEVVITAHVYHARRLRLRGSQALARGRKAQPTLNQILTE